MLKYHEAILWRELHEQLSWLFRVTSWWKNRCRKFKFCLKDMSVVIRVSENVKQSIQQWLCITDSSSNSNKISTDSSLIIFLWIYWKTNCRNKADSIYPLFESVDWKQNYGSCFENHEEISESDCWMKWFAYVIHSSGK